MKLTIGMIVKNEEKYLERCLSALKPILDNIDSELIITDTGSTDRTVEIAEKFTDKVLHFEWINDFAAARNTGYEIAQGEWFMFVDADEIFQSCDGIIEFFNSGEYKKYRSASFVIRNYYKSLKRDITSYNDFDAPRLIQINKEIKFAGEIHEHFSVFTSPTKKISDVADHYGYLYEDKEAVEKKFERNASMLKAKIEKDPNVSPMVYLQLYETYSVTDRVDEALEFLDKGAEVARKRKSNALIPIYYHKIYLMYLNGKYDDLLMLCDEYFNIDKAIRPGPLNSDGEIYAMKASTLSNLKRYDEAIVEYKNYFEIIKDISSGKLATYDAFLLTSNFCSDINYLPLFNDFLRCCTLAGRFNTAEAYLTNTPLYKYCFEEIRTVELVCRAITILEQIEYNNAEKFVNRLNEKGKKIYIKLLFVRSCIMIDKEPVFNVIDKIGSNEDKEKKRIFQDYLCGNNEYYILEKTAELLIECTIHSMEISEIFKNGLFEIDRNKLIAMLVYILNKCTDLDIAQSDVFKAIETIKNATKLRAEKQYKECISEMKRVVSIYEPLAPIVSEYCNGVVKEFEQNAKAEQPQNEMHKLASSIKNKIKAYIASGNMSAAKKTLDEFRKIMPNDPEIEELNSQIQ